MVMLVTFSFIELWNVEKTVKEIVTTIDTASDLAFYQVQAVEEVLGGKDNTLKIKVLSNSGGVEERPLFDLLLKYDLYDAKSLDKKLEVEDKKIEIDSSSSSSSISKITGKKKDKVVSDEYENIKKEVFEKLFVENDDFKNNISFLNKSFRPVRYYDSTGANFTWYYIPNISLMGYSMFKLKDIPVYDSSGNKVKSNVAKAILDYYNLSSYEKNTGSGDNLYLTPLNMGITYINKDLLNVLFTNNLQLLLTSKYDNDRYDGVYKGEYYSNMIDTTNISSYHPINNGNFTVLLGEETVVDGVKIYKGVSPEIEYKNIDMYDSANDDLLKVLFGANKGSYSTKAEYLKSLDSGILNPVTGAPYTKKVITVAKVKFYVHVLIPYKSIIVRDIMRFKDNINYFSVGDNVMTFEITKLYAVKP